MGFPVEGTVLDTSGLRDPRTKLRQRPHAKLFADCELGHDMTKMTDAQQGSFPSQIQHRKKRQAWHLVMAEDVWDEVEPSGAHSRRQ